MQEAFRFGLFCSLSDNSLSTNHTCTLKNLSKESVLQKTAQNAADLIALLEFAHANNIKVFRLGNSFIPFLSHPSFDPSWREDLAPLLDATKERLRDFDIRITQHPGQYTLLSSPREDVTQNSLDELRASFWLFDRLGIDEEGIILIHGGGAYDDKESALERVAERIKENSWLKERLALENDERIFHAQEINALCLEVGIPFVFDIYHHSLNPSPFERELFIKSYGKRRAKVHLSSKGEGRFGNHGDYIFEEDFNSLKELFGEMIYNIDIMIEAKQKEEAIKRLRSYYEL